MIYKFKSKATGDLIMLAAHGDQILRIVGKEPASKGIVAVSDIPAAIASIEAAVVEDKPIQSQSRDESATASGQPSHDDVSLRQRTRPLLDMMRRAHTAGADIVWGV
jgi:hypothetical protein